MTKQELLKLIQEYADHGVASAVFVLEEFSSYPQSMRTKERLCCLVVSACNVLLRGMTIEELDREFTRATYWQCMDYLLIDGRAKNAKK